VTEATGEINTNTNLVPLDLKPGKVLPAVATTEIRFTTNLNADAPVGEAFSTTVKIYDSLGVAHPVTIRFEKTAPGQWDYEMTVPSSSVSGGGSGVLNTGQITFNSDGKLATPASDVTGITFAPASGADQVTFTWDLWDELDPTKTYMTQYRLPSSTSQTFQNGQAAGTLDEMIVRSDGVIEGIFSNGETAPLAQIGMALFASPQNLVRTGNNLYARTTQSGEPTIGTPATGGRGNVQGNALELSNVDIAEEFIKLILYQRQYQANSRIITTADQITREAIQLKQ